MSHTSASGVDSPDKLQVGLLRNVRIEDALHQRHQARLHERRCGNDEQEEQESRRRHEHVHDDELKTHGRGGWWVGVGVLFLSSEARKTLSKEDRRAGTQRERHRETERERKSTNRQSESRQKINQSAMQKKKRREERKGGEE